MLRLRYKLHNKNSEVPLQVVLGFLSSLPDANSAAARFLPWFLCPDGLQRVGLKLVESW